MLLHYTLAFSGLRFEEALELLRNTKQLRVVELGYGAVRVHLDMHRGSKRRTWLTFQPGSGKRY